MLTDKLFKLYKNQPVIHLKHGIGRYVGMIILETGEIKGEYLIISYANDDKLYLPVTSLHLISPYISSFKDEKIPLHKLGGGSWIRTKKKVAEQIRDTAAELLEIYAQRKIRKGFAFHCYKENYQNFCKEFLFELTTDQIQAINDVLKDMCQPLIMNRLICGDVGFGKTEIAMRAAFVATENNKQVAILVPSTLLAQQHFDNFRHRFVNWPVCIEMISRFRSIRDRIHILKQTADGKIDILIGTHNLLQKNIKWLDLGLLIIDEEHRFGVRQKERISTMYSNIDCLTLTATPIPRTLNMAINSIQDLSIISTPPSSRLVVKTFVCEYNKSTIRKVILREILREGQVYYIHNNIKNIKTVAQNLKILVPEAKITIAHGQMVERDLEKVMNDFYRQFFNVLVCTTIIETGIDIANVNTIIIECADQFGLAQLYQLRGRVGRSHKQAYAYLIVSSFNILSQNAKKRLQVISSLEDLGVGFALSTHDLEIRGAGEFLGEEQSGQIKNIGFFLYTKMLEKAIDNIKNGIIDSSFEDLTRSSIDVDIHVPAFFSEFYIPDVNLRLLFYRRINNATNDSEIKNLQTELINKFGLLPDSACNLLKIAILKQQAYRLGIKYINITNNGGFIEFYHKNNVDPKYIVTLLQKNPDIYRLINSVKLVIKINLINPIIRLQYIDSLLQDLQKHLLY